MRRSFFHFATAVMENNNNQPFRFIDTHAHVHYTMKKLNISSVEAFEKTTKESLKVKNDDSEYLMEAIVNVYCEPEEYADDYDHGTSLT